MGALATNGRTCTIKMESTAFGKCLMTKACSCRQGKRGARSHACTRAYAVPAQQPCYLVILLLLCLKTCTAAASHHLLGHLQRRAHVVHLKPAPLGIPASFGNEASAD